jgi:hypothetical protein
MPHVVSCVVELKRVRLGNRVGKLLPDIAFALLLTVAAFGELL